jgi:hypothetical protein
MYLIIKMLRTRTSGTVESNSLADEIRLAALYAEFADEDRKFAEEGLSDYNEGLIKEDTS